MKFPVLNYRNMLQNDLLRDRDSRLQGGNRGNPPVDENNQELDYFHQLVEKTPRVFQFSLNIWTALCHMNLDLSGGWCVLLFSWHLPEFNSIFNGQTFCEITPCPLLSAGTCNRTQTNLLVKGEHSFEHSYIWHVQVLPNLIPLLHSEFLCNKLGTLPGVFETSRSCGHKHIAEHEIWYLSNQSQIDEGIKRILRSRAAIHLNLLWNEWNVTQTKKRDVQPVHHLISLAWSGS